MNGVHMPVLQVGNIARVLKGDGGHRDFVIKELTARQVICVHDYSTTYYDLNQACQSGRMEVISGDGTLLIWPEPKEPAITS